MHVIVSDEADVQLPDPAAGFDTARLRLLLALPQVCGQAVHGLHDVTVQSTGHVVAAHARSSVVLEHALPPFAAGVRARVLLCTAVPHVAEQELQACQAPIEQSIGQSKVLQFCVAMRTGHCAPPSLAADNTERDWLLRPVPQLTEQDAHILHVLTVQSTGHATLPHSELSCVTGHSNPRPFRG